VAESIFTTQTPAAGDVSDATQYTLGTVWTPAVNGTVTHIRVFAPVTAPSSAFVGLLYSITGESAGVELGRATFGSLTAAAWNTVALAGGVSVTAGSYYVACYVTPDRFVLTTNFFTSAGVTNGNLTAPQSGSPYGNGRIHVGDGFPEITSGQQSSYFADVVFDASSVVRPTPVVAPARLGRSVPNTPIIVRSTLADPPAETRPAPIVVAAPARSARPRPAVIARGGLSDITTPPPLVVVVPAKRPLLAAPIIWRASLADPPPPVGGESTPPLVVTAPPVIRAGRVLVIQARRLATPVPGTLTASGQQSTLTASGQAASTLTASGT